jgi:hypothetical protein
MHRQVMSMAFQALRRRELGRQVGRDELEDALRPSQILEAMLAEIDQLRSLGYFIADQIIRRLR